MEQVPETDPLLKARILYNLGNLYQEKLFTDQALAAYKESLEIGQARLSADTNARETVVKTSLELAALYDESSSMIKVIHYLKIAVAHLLLYDADSAFRNKQLLLAKAIADSIPIDFGSLLTD